MGKSAAAVALLFNGLKQSGEARILGTALDGRYARLPAEETFENRYEFYRTFRSGTLFKPMPGASTMILFGPTASGTGYSSEWQGDYLLLTNNSGSEWNLNLADFNFDKRTEAVLLVYTQRAKETRIFWSQAAAPILTLLSANLPDEVKLDGDPWLSWNAFTGAGALSGGGSLSAKRIYLTIDQDIAIVLPWWWADYSARIKFWIRLRVNSDGVAVGWVQRVEYWVESGPLAELVGAILSPNLKLAVPKINDAITAALVKVNAAGTLTDIYFLPGKTPAADNGVTGALSAKSVNDVTVVFEGV